MPAETVKARPALKLTGPEQAQVAARVLKQAEATLEPLDINDAAIAAAIGTLVFSIQDRRPGSRLAQMVARLMEER